MCVCGAVMGNLPVNEKLGRGVVGEGPFCSIDNTFIHWESAKTD